MKYGKKFKYNLGYFSYGIITKQIIQSLIYFLNEG